MLTIEYLREHGVYLVIPVYNGRENPNQEFVFGCEKSLNKFVTEWQRNPYAAEFAYHIQQRNMV